MALATFIRDFGHEVARSKNSSSAAIAWLVSNCGTHSERENFVEQLQNFVKVDVYGECGPLKVDRNYFLLMECVFHCSSRCKNV